MVLYWRRYGRAGGCQINGGLAQLGEHLPCKQGVESSNLLVSIGNKHCNYFWVNHSEITSKVSYFQWTCYASSIVPWKPNIEQNLKSWIKSKIQDIRGQTWMRVQVRKTSGNTDEKRPKGQLPEATTLCGGKVKLKRAQGGCLGTKSRRKTW